MLVSVSSYIASIVQNVKHSLLLLVTLATDLSLRAIKCAVLLSSAYNVEASCHKHFFISGYQHTAANYQR